MASIHPALPLTLLLTLACQRGGDPYAVVAPPSHEDAAWRQERLTIGEHPSDEMSNGAVAVVDDEIWLTWEESDRMGHRQVVQRLVAGVADPPFLVGGPRTGGSFVASIAVDPARSEVALLKLVDCDRRWLRCGPIPVEVELVLIDRATQGARSLPVNLIEAAGYEKGRGSVDLRGADTMACFKAKREKPFSDDVLCVDSSDAALPGLGPPFAVSDAEGADDHPSVLLRSDGTAVVAHTSARYGLRGTMLVAPGAEGFLLHDQGQRGEDPVLIEGVGGALHVGWVASQGALGDDSQVVVGTCEPGTDCALPESWTSEAVATGSSALAVSLAIADGRLIASYGLEGAVYLAIRCDDGWRFERPWDHGTAQWTKHGQPSLAATADGRIELVFGEFDPAGLPSVWWGERTGPVCQ